MGIYYGNLFLGVKLIKYNYNDDDNDYEIILYENIFDKVDVEYKDELLTLLRQYHSDQDVRYFMYTDCSSTHETCCEWREWKYVNYNDLLQTIQNIGGNDKRLH